MQVVDALIKADKDFDLLVVPGGGHGAGDGGGLSSRARLRDRRRDGGAQRLTGVFRPPGLQGEYVPVAETVESFEAIINGELDEVPEQAFLNVGGVEQVLALARACADTGDPVVRQRLADLATRFELLVWDEGDPVRLRAAAEEALAAIWCEVLAIAAVGIHDNFLELGGESLQATRIINKAAAELQYQGSLWDFFAAPTIAEMAADIVDAAG